MLLGAPNHCNASAAVAAAAVVAASKNSTDFSIAAIMSRRSLSREPSERSLSKYTGLTQSFFGLNKTFSHYTIYIVANYSGFS